jgi:hypothetical protein
MRLMPRSEAVKTLVGAEPQQPALAQVRMALLVPHLLRLVV